MKVFIYEWASVIFIKQEYGQDCSGIKYGTGLLYNLSYYTKVYKFHT